MSSWFGSHPKSVNLTTRTAKQPQMMNCFLGKRRDVRGKQMWGLEFLERSVVHWNTLKLTLFALHVLLQMPQDVTVEQHELHVESHTRGYLTQYSSVLITSDHLWHENSGQFETDTDRSHGTFNVCTDAYVQERSKCSSSTEVVQNLNINRNRCYIQIKFLLLMVFWLHRVQLCASFVQEAQRKSKPLISMSEF